MNDRDEFAVAALAVDLVKITIDHVNAQIAVGCACIDVDAEHAHTLRYYREALSAVNGPCPTGVADPPEPQHVAETCRQATHDAEPAATAPSDAMPLPAAPVTHGEGSGDTRAAQEPVAWAAYERESDAEPIVLCFKESRARDEVRGVAGSRVVPLYAAPPAASSAILEAVAEVVYEAMRFDRNLPTPRWAALGNSSAQQEARDAARQILLIVQQPAAGATLTDAERDLLRRLGPSGHAQFCHVDVVALSPDERKTLAGLLDRLGGAT